MSGEAGRRIYWDSSVFLTFFDPPLPERAAILDALVAEHTSGRVELVTSAIAIVEVAFSAQERQRRSLDSETEQAIEAFWSDEMGIVLWQLDAVLASRARGMVRAALLAGRSLKPADAIHMATANAAGVVEMHTYDRRLLGLRQIAGVLLSEPREL
jgi:predicted nucleic acid-binding protein